MTSISVEDPACACREEQERRLVGRNIRGKHARLYIGQLEEVRCLERGEVFTQLQLRYRLPGTVRADVMVKFYEAMPRVDFCLQLVKPCPRTSKAYFCP